VCRCLRAYKTGSFGVELQYQIDANGQERRVYEQVVLRKLNSAGELVDTQYGAKTLERRLLSFGLDSGAINELGIPRTPTQEYNLTPIIGTEVAIYCRDAEYMGKPKLEVSAVFPLDREQGA